MDYISIFLFCNSAVNSSLLLAITLFNAKFINVLHRLPAYHAAGKIATFVKFYLPRKLGILSLTDWIGSNISLKELASGKRH